MDGAHAADALDEAVERAAVRALLGLLTPLDDLVRVRASVRARARARVRVRVRVRVGVGVRVRVRVRGRVRVRVRVEGGHGGGELLSVLDRLGLILTKLDTPLE